MSDHSLRSQLQALESNLKDYKDANALLDLHVRSLQNNLSEQKLEESRLHSIIQQVKGEEIG